MPAMIHNPNGQWLMIDRCSIFCCTFTEQKLWLLSARVSFAATPFSKRTSINSLCLLEGNQSVCLLIVCDMCTSFSISLFLCCWCVCVFLQFFKLTLRSTYRPLPPSKSQHTTDRPSKLLCSPRTRQALLYNTGEGVLSECASQIYGLLNWLFSCSTTTHWSVACPGDTLKALKRPITGRFGGNVLWLVLVCQASSLKVCIVAWALEACASQHRLNPLKGLHFSWDLGGHL
jgi:hypothetical protein